MDQIFEIWGSHSGVAADWVCNIKVIRPRCVLFKWYIKNNPTQHSYMNSGLPVSALLTNRRQTFINSRPVKVLLACRIKISFLYSICYKII